MGGRPSVPAPPAFEAPGAVSREVGRLFQNFGRAVRARPLYKTDNNVVVRQMNELKRGFDEVLGRFEELSIKVRPDSFTFQDERILEEPNPDESIPFAFFRDGIRRLDFSRGLTMDELDALVSATAQGLAFSGLGDDIVSFLWQQELDHLHYVVVDTNITAASASPADGEAVEVDVDEQIDAVLLSIYGNTNDDVGARSVHIDQTDIPAKSIADSLDAIDELAPGFHPTRGLKQRPAYADALRDEAAGESEEHVLYRVLSSTLDAFCRSDDGKTRELLASGLFDLYDDALVTGNFGWAGRIILSARALAEFVRDDRVHRWIDEAASETRLRAIAGKHLQTASAERLEELAGFFRSAGSKILPAMLALLPEIKDPLVRRAVSNLAIEMGVTENDGLKELVVSEQAHVAVEAVHILAAIGAPGALPLLEAARIHADPAVRLAFFGALRLFPDDKRSSLARASIRDPEPRVAAAAVTCLAVLGGTKGHEYALSWAEDPARLREEPLEVKRAILTHYARSLGTKALSVLARYVKDGEGKLARKGAEELAIAALHAMQSVKTPGAVNAIKHASSAWNRKVRDVAKGILGELNVEPSA